MTKSGKDQKSITKNGASQRFLEVAKFDNLRPIVLKIKGS